MAGTRRSLNVKYNRLLPSEQELKLEIEKELKMIEAVLEKLPRNPQ
ncbi:MAG: hypothetical protein V1844_13010 [Pseudomonadota bacterium]